MSVEWKQDYDDSFYWLEDDLSIDDVNNMLKEFIETEVIKQMIKDVNDWSLRLPAENVVELLRAKWLGKEAA